MKNKNEKNKEQEENTNIPDEKSTSIEELAEMNDKFLRLNAEFENYKKRTVKERFDLLNIASEGVITSLLPIIDDFERAIPALTDDDRQGIELIYTKLHSILKSFGLEVISTKDLAFDAEIAEAVAQVPNEEKKGIVIDEIEKGYRLKTKVIRYAKVVVGS